MERGGEIEDLGEDRGDDCGHDELERQVVVAVEGNKFFTIVGVVDDRSE